ncbi:MAG: 30S ribosomal protein S6 [Nitrospira sp.]|nr:30S ribosomal protein S6 [Nitrospira sp.]
MILTERCQTLLHEREDKVERYEALVILDLTGKPDGAKESSDAIEAMITAAGGKVDSVQKMDRKPFARVTNPQRQAGYYMNIAFDLKSSALSKLQKEVTARADVYRVLVHSSNPAAVVEAAAK